jgi:hypothetical protein
MKKVRRKIRTLREARQAIDNPRGSRIIWTEQAREQAFEKFWLSKPTVSDFKRYLTGKIYTAHMVYFIGTHPFEPTK